jgi:hypothetical protein
MIIGSGINIGNGIKITSESATSLMYSLLSSAGQSAYTSTTPGNWFIVSSTDYAAVFSGLASVTKYCMTDSQLTLGNNGWVGADAQAFGTSFNAQLASGTYVIGFVTRTQTAAAAVTPLISTALPTSGSYSAIANSPSIAGGVLQYCLRRAPTATAATSYLGIVGTSGVNMETASGVSVSNWYSTSGPPYTTWSAAYNANPIIYQVLGTPTYQWS